MIGSEWRIVGYAVKDQQGEVYALRKTSVEAQNAKVDAELHLDEAATSGHPRAAGWVGERLPIEIRPVTRQQWDELAEQGTPVLDREP